jgi:hypothetical protein
MAAIATFALKAGEWFRRARLLMVSPVRGDYRRLQAEIPLIVLRRFPGPALKKPSSCWLKHWRRYSYLKGAIAFWTNANIQKHVLQMSASE